MSFCTQSSPGISFPWWLLFNCCSLSQPRFSLAPRCRLKAPYLAQQSCLRRTAARLPPQGCSCLASSPPLPLPELPLLSDAAAVPSTAANPPKPRALPQAAEAGRAGAGLLGGQHGPAGLASPGRLPSARPPLKAKGQRPSSAPSCESCWLGASALGNAASLERKIDLCALSPAV